MKNGAWKDGVQVLLANCEAPTWETAMEITSRTPNISFLIFESFGVSEITELLASEDRVAPISTLFNGWFSLAFAAIVTDTASSSQAALLLR